MKKTGGLLLAVLLSFCMVMTAAGSADTSEILRGFLGGITNTDLAEASENLDDSELQELLEQLQDLLGDSASGESQEAQAPEPYVPEPAVTEPTESPATEQNGLAVRRPSNPEPQEQPEETPAIEEPDGSGIPKDEPVSTTGTTYGYQGTFDLDNASSETIQLTEGEWDVNDVQLIFWGGSVVDNSGTSSLAVHNSYIRGETAVQTAPVAGSSGNLLVAGNIRAALGSGNSETFYINSTIAARNWAALATDAAKPAPAEGQKELSLYAYGSEAITMDGGYGANSDLFCNLYSYGSHIQAAEIGMISGTYGKITVGTIGDGEANAAMDAILTKADKDPHIDKELPSIIEGGRNALMIHSVNLPAYWEYEGYSQSELPLQTAQITGHGSMFRTDLSLDKGVQYEPQKQAYIDHTKGSAILIKSTNVNMALDHCSIIPDEKGTGYLVQTVYNNDIAFMNAVPDGLEYPGINISFRDMELRGDIAHEDYQRSCNLVLAATTLEGAVNEYDCAHWKQAAEAEGFTDYSLDQVYGARHGLQLSLAEGSVWTVTKESHLSKLDIGPDSKVEGIIYVGGEKKANIPGKVYEGQIVVIPGVEEIEEETTTAEESTEHKHDWQLINSTKATCTEYGYKQYVCSICGEYKMDEVVEPTGHKWIHSGGYPASCTEDGTYGWVCTECGESYLEVMPGTAMGHDFQMVFSQPVTCLLDGYDKYQCTRCLEIRDIYTGTALGHDYQLTAAYTSCTEEWEEYTCSRCGDTYREDYWPVGHLPDYSTVGPTAGAESITHTWQCINCGMWITEVHTPYDPCWCGYSGPRG